MTKAMRTDPRTGEIITQDEFDRIQEQLSSAELNVAVDDLKAANQSLIDENLELVEAFEGINDEITQQSELVNQFFGNRQLDDLTVTTAQPIVIEEKRDLMPLIILGGLMYFIFIK